jgi:hypothetical protein
MISLDKVTIIADYYDRIRQIDNINLLRSFAVGILGPGPESAFNDRPSRLGWVERAERAEVGRQPVLHRPVAVLRRHPSSLRASSWTG